MRAFERATALSRRRGVLPTLLFAGSLALYAATAIRTPGWLDDTLILYFARNATIGTWVNTHNLFNLLGHAWISVLGFLDPHAALTLFCGVLASVSVLFAYHAGRELTGKPAAAGLAAAALAVSHSLWWHATVVEVYALNAAIITPVVFLVLRFFRRRSFASLVTAFFLFGIGVFNHVLMGLFAPAYLALFVMLLAKPHRLGWRRGLLLVAATLAGCVPYLLVFVRDSLAVLWSLAPNRSLGSLLGSLPRAVAFTFDDATGSFFKEAMFPRGLALSQRLFWRLNYLFILWYNFPAAALPLAAWGAVRLARPTVPRPFAVFFALAILAQAIWSSNYLIWDMYAFSLPVYVLASLPLAAGIDGLLEGGRPWLRRLAVATLFLPLALYPAATGIKPLSSIGRWYISRYPEVEAAHGIWDPVRYFFNPIRAGYRGVEEFCLGVLARLPPNAHYWDVDNKGDYPLRYYYFPVKGLRPDVSLHSMFSLRIDEPAARYEAAGMRDLLEADVPVFFCSLARPEREVLVQLALLQDPTADAAALRGLDADAFRSSLRAIAVEEVPLGTRPGLAIYQVRLLP